jgi:cytochrome c-type biogenesis protein CcmE
MVSATKVLLSVAVVGGGGGMLIYSSLAEAEYYKHVDEVTMEPDRWLDKSLKVHGFVEPGSIDERIEGQSTVRTFILQYEGERIKVTHTGPKPDTFRDLAEVVAKGKLVAASEGEGPVLEASELMAKCPSKYEQDKRTREMTPAGASAGASAGPAARGQQAPDPILASPASSSR